MIKDSGARREFSSGAVRDMGDDGLKGRTDLLPLDVVADILSDSVLKQIYHFMQTQDADFIQGAIATFARLRGWDMPTCMLEVAIHFQEGANKYAERNWEKGIPDHCYIDSGIRHYLKWLRGDYDEPHDRAFVWNMLCLMHNLRHLPDCNDLPEVKDDREMQELRDMLCARANANVLREL